jgi:hypothetical protein
MTAYTVLRFIKLKSWGAVGGAGSHNARLRQTLNADPKALAKNRFLIGSPGDDLAAFCQAMTWLPSAKQGLAAGRYAKTPFMPWRAS